MGIGSGGEGTRQVIIKHALAIAKGRARRLMTSMFSVAANMTTVVLVVAGNSKDNRVQGIGGYWVHFH